MTPIARARARGRKARRCREYSCGSGPKVVEAGVPGTCALRGLGIDSLEVLDDRVHRGVQAVEVEAVEADLGRARRQLAVPLPQPAEEGDDVGVPPHPGREAAEVGERLRARPRRRARSGPPRRARRAGRSPRAGSTAERLRRARSFLSSSPRQQLAHFLVGRGAKSWYQSPTAWKGCGVTAHSISS